jgi:MSHA biogenesis protein MshK
MKTAPWAISGLLAIAIPGAGVAQGLVDPTKPPTAGDASGEGGAPAAGPQLQSVLLSSGRKVAVIDGQSVALGHKAGEFTLVALSPSEAVLKRGEETKVLRLYPGAEKMGSKPDRRASPSSEAKK